VLFVAFCQAGEHAARSGAANDDPAPVIVWPLTSASAGCAPNRATAETAAAILIERNSFM